MAHKKPTAKEVISELEKRKVEKAVFCGFGEPLYALDVLLEVAKYLKKIGASVRVNTNGQAKLIAGSGVAKKMKGLVDVVSVSLNASTAENIKTYAIRYSESKDFTPFWILRKN